MRIFLTILLTVLLAGCVSTGGTASHTLGPTWQFVFANDAEGNREAGSKDDLLAAIRNGKPVRIFTAGRRIEHAGEALYLSVFDGEAFAQIAAIESQRPETDPARIMFRNPGEKWRSIVGTNGFVTAFIDGRKPNVRTGATKWFVQP